MNEALLDHYRFSKDLADFKPDGEFSKRSGFFKFGHAVCYGPSTLNFPSALVTGKLDQAWQKVRIESSQCYLPFDPTQIVQNLRFERYFDHSKRFLSYSLLRNTYYSMRPFFPHGLRRHLQRMLLRNWNKIPFPGWPVDRTVESIFEGLTFLLLKSLSVEKMPFIWFWPHGLPGCVAVTHDVETRAGRDFSSRLMDIDDSAGIKTSFGLVPETRYEISGRFLDSIRSRGFEINIHDLNHDGQLFRNRQEFRRRAEKINRYARDFGALGFRSGVLYRNLDWYDALEFSYDMSVPNTAHLEPQRGGCCTVTPYFVGDIVELPSTMTQDYALFYILNDYSTKLWKRQLELIMEKHGLGTVICHPDYLIRQGEQSVYRSLLEHLCELRDRHRMWIALPADIASWWRERSRMTLVREGGQWRIAGAGSERARIAYACLDGESVRYEVEDPTN